MKKVIVLSALCFFFSAGYAAKNTNIKPIMNSHNVTDQKSQKEQKQKKAKYDFSLFKFITPKSESTESDTLKLDKKLPKQKGLSNELSELYEKPRSFLMFS